MVGVGAVVGGGGCAEEVCPGFLSTKYFTMTSTMVL